MSPVFRKKSPAKKLKGEKTVAILDIESGSVGGALTRLSGNDAPKLFAEVRVQIPLLHTRDTEVLAREIEKATNEVVDSLSKVAARVRNHEALAPHGEVDHIAMFFAPPWAAMHLSGGTADYVEPMRRAAAVSARTRFGDVRMTTHPFGTAIAHGSVLIFGAHEPYLLCMINGEISELLLITPGAIVGRSTVPLGTYTTLRTLVSHGGVSLAEARSYLNIAGQENHALYEPYISAQKHFASEFTDVVRALKGGAEPRGILIMAGEPTGELFARSLAGHQELVDLFPEGGTVRALRATHAMPFIAAHAGKPDLPLMLESLFVDAKFGGI